MEIKKASEAKNIKQNILLVGEPGSGKTNLLTTLKGKTFVFAFDPNALATLRKSENISYETYYESDDIDTDGAKRKGGIDKVIKVKNYTRFQRDLLGFIQDGTIDEFDNIVLDSFTTFQNSVMDYVLSLEGRTNKTPELSDYGIASSLGYKVCRKIAFTGKNCIFIFHTTEQKDETTGIFHKQIDALKGVKNGVPAICNHVFYTESRREKDEVKYYLHTRVTKKFSVMKTSSEKLENKIDVTFKTGVERSAQGLGKLLNI